MWVLWCAYGLLAALGLGFAGWFMYAHFRRGARGPLDDLDAQSRSIFDELEPEGTQTDFFPGKGPPPSEYLL